MCLGYSAFGGFKENASFELMAETWAGQAWGEYHTKIRAQSAKLRPRSM
jgi:hypothetical protein